MRIRHLDKVSIAVITIIGAVIFLSACSPSPTAQPSFTVTPTSTAAPTFTPLPSPTATPDLTNLVALQPSLLTALTDFQIGVQCSFPTTDTTDHAAYISQLIDQLPIVKAALVSISLSSAVAQFTLNCDPQTGQVYFASLDGKIYLLATEIGLMPAIMENGNLRIFLPEQKAGSSLSPAVFTHPEYMPAIGGAIPDFLTQKDPKTGTSLWTDEVNSIHLALNIMGIDPKSVNIKFLSWSHSIVIDTGAIEYRWGTVIESKDNPNVIYWARYDDGAKEFALRPDIRHDSRTWHYEKVTVPHGLDSTAILRAYFPEGSEKPFVYLADPNKKDGDGNPMVIGMFNPDRGVFLNLNNEVLVPPVPDYYPGVAPSLDKFPEIKITDIPAIISDLRSKPSLLADADNPVPIQVFQGARFIGVTCNADVVNCEVAASAKVLDEGHWAHLIFIEVRNADGSRGYLTGFIYDGLEFFSPGYFQLLLNDPHPTGAFCLRQGLGDPKYEAELAQKLPYSNHLLHQPDYQELLSEALETGTIPAQLESTIILLSFFGEGY